MRALRRMAAAMALLVGLTMFVAAPADASGVYKTYTGQAYDYTQYYCSFGACVVPTVTFTSHFETTLTSPPYGYFCKTPNMAVGGAGSTCWLAGSDQLWAGQVVELICYSTRTDVNTGERVVKMAWGLRGDTKPTRIGYYLAAGENASNAEETYTGHC